MIGLDQKAVGSAGHPSGKNCQCGSDKQIFGADEQVCGRGLSD
jgi:hypothetical protein